MTEHSTLNKVVVIGGGYAGTIPANRLRMHGGVDITLVNPRPRFVDRVRLHQFVAGTGEVAVDYGSLLGEGVRLVVDSATRIDTAARTVELKSGRALDFDYVLYAVGSTGAIPSSVPVRLSSRSLSPSSSSRGGCVSGWTRCLSMLRSPWSAASCPVSRRPPSWPSKRGPSR